MEKRPVIDRMLQELFYKRGILFARDRLYNYVKVAARNAANNPASPYYKRVAGLKGRLPSHRRERQWEPRAGEDNTMRVKERARDGVVSRRYVQEWLDRQEIYAVHRQVLEDKNITRRFTSAPFKIMQIDLTMMPKGSRRYKYILVATDLFTKMAWTAPLHTKSAEAVWDAFQGILTDVDQQFRPAWLDANIPLPQTVQSDNGTEFRGVFTERLTERGINQVFGTPYQPQSQGQVERLNGTIKAMISKHRSFNDTTAWVPLLPRLMRNYNNTLAKTTQATPLSVALAWKENEQAPLVQEVRERLFQHAAGADMSMEDYQRPRFAPGDLVRLRLGGRGRQARGVYKGATKNWTRKKFRVDRRLRRQTGGGVLRNAYTVVDPESGEKYSALFYEADLLPYVHPDEVPVEYRSAFASLLDGGDSDDEDDDDEDDDAPPGGGGGGSGGDDGGDDDDDGGGGRLPPAVRDAQQRNGTTHTRQNAGASPERGAQTGYASAVGELRKRIRRLRVKEARGENHQAKIAELRARLTTLEEQGQTAGPVDPATRRRWEANYRLDQRRRQEMREKRPQTRQRTRQLYEERVRQQREEAAARRRAGEDDGETTSQRAARARYWREQDEERYGAFDGGGEAAE